MKKCIVLISFLYLYLVSTYSVAAAFLKDFPQEELKAYNALSPEAQAEALVSLQKMGNYDPDRTHIDKNGRFFIVEDSLEKFLKTQHRKQPLETSEKDIISDNPPTRIENSVPILHSLPGSPNVIYLKFIGSNIQGSAWNDNYGVPIYLAQPFAPYPFSTNDMLKIIEIWARVTEDYAPWEVDVTTEMPSTFTPTTLTALITKSTTTDGKPMPSNTSAGIAYLDTFNYYFGPYYSPALIYADRLSNKAETIAEAVSHEIGHNFGLSHQGTSTYGYWGGEGISGSEISWGCIMGAGYYRSVVKFCNGNYRDSNNTEDALAVITEHVALRAPSVGNSMQTAAVPPLRVGNFSTSGILEKHDSSNFFLLENIQGSMSILALTYQSKEFRNKSASSVGNNICLGLQLFDASGNLLKTAINPNGCSINDYAFFSLPKAGNYYVRIYPVSNPTMPIPLYGSVGQYYLAVNASPASPTSPLSITPPHSTLALNAKMTFDSNDTVRVRNGVPPFKFTSTLNSFSQSGTTYTYTALKPGLDTIFVTDSKGAKGSTQITVSYMDFGGMYGYSRVGNYNNPITGTLGCPSGYRSQQVMGTANVDYPLFYCYRMHSNGIPANYDFGGIYSHSGSGLRLNPSTEAGSCPTGYSSAQVFGENSNSPDYPAYFCYKTHSEAIPEAVPFAGMYAPGASTNYNNPATGKLSCPTCTISTMMLGTANIDYPFYFCSYPPSPLKISPQYTNMALNSTMTFDANDTVRVSGGNPPFTYSTILGTFTKSGTMSTYTASKPGLDTITVTDSKGRVAKAKVTVAYVDFGGVYGNSKDGNFNNPITGTFGCPSGYISRQVMGTSGVDYPLYYCYRRHTTAIPADYDFGGMYSYSSSGQLINPITGTGSCPTGYTEAQVYGDSSNQTDYPAYLCYKPHNESVEEAAHFGGMYAPASKTSYNNPITGQQNCPTGWSNARMLGTINVDYPLYFCY